MRFVVTQLLALSASVGGPLYLFERLQYQLGRWPALAACFGPVALMLLGALCFDESPRSGLARAVVRLGYLGALALLGINLFTALSLLTGRSHPYPTLIVFGIVAGCIACLGYWWSAARFLRAGTAAK
jgi:hypothetical protein